MINEENLSTSFVCQFITRNNATLHVIENGIVCVKLRPVLKLSRIYKRP